MENRAQHDRYLIDRLIADEPDAFEAVYKRYAGDLLSYASQKLSSLEEARDIVQDIFLKLYERRNKLVIEGSLRAYLFAALKYKIIDHIRKYHHKKYYAELLRSVPDHTSNPVLNSLIFNDLNDMVERALHDLPSRTQETFLLSRREHLSIREIAAYMDVSERTVKNQLTTALKRLRPLLTKIVSFGMLLFVFQ